MNQTLEDYGKNFQIRIIFLLLTDHSYANQMLGVLKEQYFTHHGSKIVFK